ncbi:MAG: CooT family nickel-binding protein [Desulfobulbaceae bacterium]|nr:CooT family nickel-binding protein [Desulfobulbaceae bacterium]
MCDFRVVLRQGEGETLIMENVTELRADGGIISIKSLFDGQKDMPATVLRSIDFLANTVRLEKV